MERSCFIFVDGDDKIRLQNGLRHINFSYMMKIAIESSQYL